MVPMIVRPDHGGDGSQGDAVLLEDLAGVLADAEARDHIA